MIYPDPKTYMDLAKQYSLIPVYEKCRADFETPLTIFIKTRAQFLLESVDRGENVGRYSFIALGKKSVLRLKQRCLDICEYDDKEIIYQENHEIKNPLTKIREYMNRFQAPVFTDLPPFFGGAIGYLGYETVRYYEDIPVFDHDQDIPDGLLIVPEVILVYDSIIRSVQIIVSSTPGKNPEKAYALAESKIKEITAALAKPLNYKSQTSTNNQVQDISIIHHLKKEDFLQQIKKCKEYIRDGEIIQAVLSQKFSIKTDISALELYRTLRILNPSPYLFLLDFDQFHLIGSSPEVMVRVQDKEIMLKPIAGTRQRGRTLNEDIALARELIADVKEKAEHLMLVDLGRNDLGRVAVAGTVEVTDFMNIEKYSHVMHIVSTVKAELDKKYDIFDVIKATFPAGTLTGAPKIRAMEIISELEGLSRGPYGGMVLNLGFNGNMDSCITIRTIILKNKTATIQVGAGIVADSVPENEYQETMNKAQAMLETIKITTLGGLT